MRLQPEVDGCAVAEYDVLERLDRLVVLHHFDARHVLRRDVVGRLSVTAVEHVQPFDVKVVDRLAVVAYLARFRHLDARHLAQYVGDRAVLRLGEARHVVAYGVAPEAQPRGADRHLADVGRLGRQQHEHPPGVGRNRLPAVAHRREVELRGCPVPARPEHEIARGRGSRVTQRLAQGVPRRDDGPGDGAPSSLSATWPVYSWAWAVIAPSNQSRVSRYFIAPWGYSVSSGLYSRSRSAPSHGVPSSFLTVILMFELACM